MLRERTESAIAILYEANGSNDLLRIIPFLFNQEEERSRLEILLISAGLLSHSGNLLRPLDSISLYEILAIVDEGIYPAHAQYDIPLRIDN